MCFCSKNYTCLFNGTDELRIRKSDHFGDKAYWILEYYIWSPSTGERHLFLTEESRDLNLGTKNLFEQLTNFLSQKNDNLKNSKETILEKIPNWILNGIEFTEE